MALTAGNIAFVGFNADGNDNIAFVALVDISAGETIIFEDNEWNGTGWVDTNEGAFSWTASSTVSAGTIVRIDNIGSGTIAATTGTVVDASVLAPSRGTNRGLGAGDEIIYAYQGTAAAPTFITAIANGGFNGTNGLLTNTGLTAGVNAINLSTLDDDADIAVFNAARSGQANFAAYLPIINNPTNWIAQDGTGDQSIDTTAPDVPFSSTAFTATPPAISSIDLSNYIRVGLFNLPVGAGALAEEVSAVTYNKDTDTLFVVGDEAKSIVQVSKTGQLIDSMTLNTGLFADTEGLTYVGNGQFVIADERVRTANLFTYAAGTTLTASNVQSVKLGTTVGNIGLEGITFDPLTNGFIAVKEENPLGVFQTTIDFTALTASNGSPTTVNSTDLFNPSLTGLSDFADVFAFSNLSPTSDRLLILSQASGKVVNVDRAGNISSSLTIVSAPGNGLTVIDQGFEGLTVDKNGILYLTSENGGTAPQLSVYAPSTVPNQAPTAVVLNNRVNALSEIESTLAPTRIANIAITDDQLGVNTLSLTGTDANSFEITGSSLFLKAGTVLDFETKPSFSVSVNVDDATLGNNPDATTAFTLNITDVVDETPLPVTSTSIFVTEVAPWSSGNSLVAADWFELTNKGTTSVNIAGWKVDDDSNSFVLGTTLSGITTIAAGESVIFIDSTNPNLTNPIFLTNWFGANPPANLKIGNYSGPGLGTGGDAVNIFNAAGVKQAGVTFGASPAASPFTTFDNSALLQNAAITTQSAVGVNGAFSVVNSQSITEIGSPGAIAASVVVSPTVTIAATDANAAEAGTDTGTFRITRTGATANALTVNYTVATGTGQAIGADYTPTLTGSVAIAAGQAFADIVITPVNDLLIEGSETVTINLTDTANYDLGATATATVTIADNDFPSKISTIQGASQTSPLVGQVVLAVPGIVTAVDSNGFYLQDPNPDANIATSEGILVFTGSAPTVKVGDSITVTGRVSEFIPGGASTGNLSTTQIGGTLTIAVLSSGNALPAATIIGAGGRVPPNQIIDNDGLTSFDAITDGIDFFESLEGMRVNAKNLQAVSATNSFGEIYAVVDNGSGATGLSSRGTINISPTDFNPERIQIDIDNGVFDFALPNVNVGAKIGDVTGVVGYNFGNFEIIPTEAFGSNIVASTLQPEVTTLTKSSDTLKVATYNVLNLDPQLETGVAAGDIDNDIANGRFATIAQQIVNNLGTPDIIGLQEIQDNSGAQNDGVTSASLTLQTLVNAIAAAGGPTYKFIDNTFITNNASGGQPGANIRTAFLYNDDRVDLVDGSVKTVPSSSFAAFADSRLPLIADFAFNGETVTVITNHFSSKGGSRPLFGTTQPSVGDEANGNGQENVAINGSLDQRRAQAQAVNDYFDSVLATKLDAKVVVVGDFNEFEFISPLNILAGGANPVLTNLTNSLPENDRYTFNFDGNSQSLDHILVSNNLSGSAKVDIVNINTEFVDNAQRASDHDPIVATIKLAPASPTLSSLGTTGDDVLDALPNQSFDGFKDILFTGSGNDKVNLGFVAGFSNAGDNRIDLGIGSDTIFVNKGDRLFGSEGNDIFEASESKGDNRMSGGAGDDTFFLGFGDRALGGDGNDKFFVSSGGNNLLSGGAGADQFWIFNISAPLAANTIVDFQAGTDVIGINSGGLLSFGNLTLSGNSLAIAGKAIATFTNVDVTSLTSANFVFK
ncbi:SdiA-regulated domain-containing protein [Pseudanabaena sp. FACHB-1998]|uniref:SdiA-regulated domain-containing protein n=1 Tax=Pseudanabaena sp. FACHB-1998 TaxID=2692858 RepID=UPI00167FEB9F|nr:SdiA-regulated domain-containing protein [Pseudanabaena sp. FACHB-1998]MBD2177503.1 SdiA-regulated domain-containing protein [Pseudanabaena sp. FACHB-1998]